MMTKNYEVTITVSDIFSGATTFMKFYTESNGEEVEEIVTDFGGIEIVEVVEEEALTTLSDMLESNRYFTGGPPLTEA